MYMHLLQYHNDRKLGRFNVCRTAHGLCVAVKTFEKHKKALSSTDETDHRGCMGLYEKLADTAVDMGLLKLALLYYKKQVRPQFLVGHD